MNKRYGVVLIGCGHIGQEHIEDIYFRDNIRVVATVDTREEQARLFARRYGADHYGTDYRPFLRLPETDIVIIATYVNTHLSILRDCLEAGKHVLCEKPLAPSAKISALLYGSALLPALFPVRRQPACGEPFRRSRAPSSSYPAETGAGPASWFSGCR